jgi:hypothetical protein
MTYDEFEQLLFDRDVIDPPWYDCDEATELDTLGPEDLCLVEMVFRNSIQIRTRYSEQQLYHGLNYLVNPSASDFCFRYFDPTKDAGASARVIQSMYYVFADLFGVRFTKNERFTLLPESEALGLRWLCNMWWDLLPRHGVPRLEMLVAVDRAVLETLGKIADLPNFACKEAAIHGLGHWFSACPERVLNILDSVPDLPRELVDYASSAKRGQIQ